MSFLSPLLVTSASSPILSIRPRALARTKITPIDPVRVVGCARIRSAAIAM